MEDKPRFIVWPDGKIVERTGERPSQQKQANFTQPEKQENNLRRLTGDAVLIFGVICLICLVIWGIFAIPQEWLLPITKLIYFIGKVIRI